MNVTYCGPPPLPGGLASSFNLDPVLLVALLAMAVALRHQKAGLVAVGVFGFVGGQGQLVEQRVDARARGCQPGLEGLAFLGDDVHLLSQQRVGAAQLLVAQQQALDAIGEFVDAGHGWPWRVQGCSLAL